MRVPQFSNAVQLSGRQSKVIVTNLSFTSPSTSSWNPAQHLFGSPTPSDLRLLYTTASIFVAGNMSGGRQVLFLYGDREQEHELAVHLTSNPQNGFISVHQNPHIQIRQDLTKGETVINVLPGLHGLVTLFENKDYVILYTDTQTTDTFFAPIISTSAGKFFADSFVLVGGPALVRSATYDEATKRLELTGDLDVEKDTWLTLLGAPVGMRSVRWNGREVDTMLAEESGSIKRYSLSRPSHLTSAFTPPELKDWEYADSLPEIGAEFDDDEWVTADHTTTNLPYKPVAGEHVLYGCDYG